MKRFFCSVCKKVKRVRHYPHVMDTASDSLNPVERIGVCNFHETGRVRPVPVKVTIPQVQPKKRGK